MTDKLISFDLKGGKEVTFENGIKGIIWAVRNEEEKLSLGELCVSGKNISSLSREQF